MKSRIDSFYRSLLITKLFTKGWGDLKTLQTLLRIRDHLSERENIHKLFLTGSVSINITNIWQLKKYQMIHGEFVSPLYEKYPLVVHPACRMAKFELLLPNHWRDPNSKPVCIHLAGTGDHNYWRRRRFIAKPLIDEAAIGAILIETPFYGSRKPSNQIRSNLHYVSDIFVMGACLILECYVLLEWCERQGFGPLGLTGVSMGGHMASLAAALWPKPLVVVPCLSWTTASSVFTTGVIAKSVDWDILTRQYYSESSRSLFNFKTKERMNFAQTVSKLFETYNSPVSPVNANRMASTFVTKFNKHFFKKSVLDSEVTRYMKLLMDEFTDLTKFPKIIAPELCIAVCALHDAYVPREGCADLRAVWNGVDVRYIKTGHIGAVFFRNNIFRQCIREAFERAHKKIIKNETPIILTESKYEPGRPRL